MNILSAATVRITLASALLIPSMGVRALAQEKGAQIYLTLEKAPQVVLPDADSWEKQEVKLSKDQLEQAKKLAAPAKPSIWESAFTTFIGRKAGAIVGYAIVCEEIGKHRPITFIVSAGPDGKVKDTAIMTYREPIGGEVRQEKFLDQFSGKALQNPIMQHKDIRNISGATLSVQALSRGVRKALAVLKVAYGI
jgi:Na+-translocating ferredoxin:NAD+ oxidoreductase RnfG subunit